MTWVIDRFHAAGHVDAWCRRNCHPDVHPDVVTDTNTSVCESVNSLLGRHKYVYKSITPSTWQFFWQELVDLMNSLRSV